VKKISLFLLTVVLAANLSGATEISTLSAEVGALHKSAPQQIKEEVRSDFVESFDEWNQVAEPWKIIDNNNDGKTWAPSSENAHSGAKCLKIGFAKPNNDWIVSPKLAISSNSQLKFWAKSNGTTYPEKFNVKLSETGRNVADFTTTLLEVPALPGVYTEYTIDLAAYNGKPVYLAIQNVSNDMYNMFFDDFSVSNSAISAGETEAPAFISLSGNWAQVGQPLNLKLKAADASGMPGTLQADYTIGSTPQTVTLTKQTVKGEFFYTGTIPAQTAALTTDLILHLTDTCIPANSAIITQKISWFDTFSTIETDFEDLDNFVLDFAPWTQIDQDGKTTYGFSGYDFPNENYTGSFIVFNPSAVTPALTAQSLAAHSGSKYLACLSAYQGDNNDWLITPPVNVQNGSVVEFWVKSTSTNPARPERIRVAVSTSGIAPIDFTVISQQLNAPGKDYITVPWEWTKYSLDLSSYTGSNPIRVALNCVSSDGLMLLVDDFRIGMPTVDLEAPQVLSISGNTVPMGQAMQIYLKVADATGIASVSGQVEINGQQTEIVLTPVQSGKNGLQSYTYTGSIPAQATPEIGSIKFTVKDSSPAANQQTSSYFDLKWYDNNWYGATNAYSTTAIGVSNTPWKLGVALDFGNRKVNIQKIAYICHGEPGSVGAVDWQIVRRNGDGSWSDEQLTSVKVLADQAAIGAVGGSLAEVAVNDNTELTGKAGLVLNMKNGGLFGLDARMPNGLSYILSNTGWVKLGEGAFVDFAGDWTLKCYISEPSGITEMVPGSTELFQNYPNPFNPATTICFYNNMTGNVKLTITNAKGEVVSTLLNNKVETGRHQVVFDGAGFNSGVYFYKLETPTATITKKMLLVK